LWPSIIDARARYRAVARRLRNTGLRLGLQPLTCWDCGYESHQEHGVLSVVSVVCISATSWSLIQRSPTDCGLLLCAKYKPQEQGSHCAVVPQAKKNYIIVCQLTQGMNTIKQTNSHLMHKTRYRMNHKINFRFSLYCT